VDSTVPLWDTDPKPEPALLPLKDEKGPRDRVPPRSSIRFVAFGADGRVLLSVSKDGRLVSWAPAAAKKPLDRRLPGKVHAAALAAGGRHLATANANGTVYLLRLTPRPAGYP
jgi:hypothetical protein